MRWNNNTLVLFHDSQLCGRHLRGRCLRYPISGNLSVWWYDYLPVSHSVTWRVISLNNCCYYFCRYRYSSPLLLCIAVFVNVKCNIILPTSILFYISYYFFSFCISYYVDFKCLLFWISFWGLEAKRHRRLWWWLY